MHTAILIYAAMLAGAIGGNPNNREWPVTLPSASSVAWAVTPDAVSWPVLLGMTRGGKSQGCMCEDSGEQCRCVASECGCDDCPTTTSKPASTTKPQPATKPVRYETVREFVGWETFCNGGSCSRRAVYQDIIIEVHD